MPNRLDLLRIFCAAAEARNFKEAALRLGISPQAVTRAVKDLEFQLGELLFHRNTRQVQITEYGEALAQQARAGIDGIDGLFRQRDARAGDEIAGMVRLTAPVALGDSHLVPLLAGLQATHPELRFELHLSDQATDVVDEKIDLGIRVGFMRDSRFVARVATRMPFHIVATPALIERCGMPTSLAELGKCPITAAVDPATGRPWPWFLADGQQWNPRQPIFTANDTRAEFQAVLAGLGFGQIAGFYAVPELRRGSLRAVLPVFAPAPWNVNVYRPQRGPVAARVRVVFDALVRAFADPAFFPTEP
jgi:DNA-binding transcriptional LysR family regulator